MPEEEQEKKKPGIVRRILKWIGLGLLSILLILGLIFQAPWKVITLLVIILLACTVLPKQMRKWLWLSVGAIVIALIIWVFLPDDNEGWQPYTFDEELAALEAKYAIPEEKNAARFYNILLENYNNNAMYPDFLDRELETLTMLEPWSSKDYPELARWLQQHESLIAKLMDASQIQKCRFPISPFKFGSGTTISHLATMRGWARLLIRASNNDLAENRINQGIQKYLTLLKMAKHLYQQPATIDMLVGIAIEALAIRQFNRFVVKEDGTEERLRVIATALAEIKHDWSSDLPKILEYEKLMTKNWLCSIIYEINPKGRVRLSHDPMIIMRTQFPEIIPPQTYWQRKLTKASTILGWLLMPPTPQRTAKIIDAVYERYQAMTEPAFDWDKRPRGFSMSTVRLKYYCYDPTKLITITSEKPLYRIHDQYLQVISEQQGSQILIALRRYKNENGSWPESLTDIAFLVPAEVLIDPINGDSFVYKLTEENFTLYSKGKNNIDEGGKHDKWDWDKEKTGADDWLIWPPRNRKTQEKNADAEQQ